MAMRKLNPSEWGKHVGGRNVKNTKAREGWSPVECIFLISGVEVIPVFKLESLRRGPRLGWRALYERAVACLCGLGV